MGALPRLPRRGITTAVLAALLLAVLLVVIGGMLLHGQNEARRDLRARFALRADLTAGFMESLIEQGLDLRVPGEVVQASAHLATAVPIKDQRTYLVDQNMRVLAASNPETIGSLLPVAEPALGPPTPGATPLYLGALHPGEQVAASSRVGDTGLVVVFTVPTARLYQPLDGSRGPQWFAFALFALLGVFTVVLLLRLIRGRAELDWALRADVVTGVRNRRHLQERLQEVASVSRRHRRTWAVLMIDVDHFKRINDELGHAGGDRVLREVAQGIVEESRLEDLAGRWGGDEFLVILPEADAHGAEAVGERILSNVRARLGDNGSLSIGCAAGLAVDSEVLLYAADAALYEAKQQGRARVIAGEVTADAAAPDAETV